MLILIAGAILSNCYSFGKIGDYEKDKISTNGEKVGIPNPSAVYCGKLGYGYKIVTNEKGGQHGVCMLPNKTECMGWNFYRGKCGQEWSYCKQQGYDLKDLEKNEGWFEGTICINKITKEEIGTVYNLMNMNLSKSLP